MTATEDDIAKALAELSAEYAATLDERVARIGAAITRARGASNDALEVAEREAHRLRGTAGSFGFDAISKVAERLELALAAYRAGAGTFGPCDDAFEELVRVRSEARGPHRSEP